MKQFWLGMTSKIAEMRENVKSKLHKDKPKDAEFVENLEEGGALGDGFEDYSTQAMENQSDAKESKFKRPFRRPVVEEETEELYEKPIIIKEPISTTKILVISLILIILGGVGFAYYYIANIDWNQHKDKIAEQFSDITGKRIVFDGPVHLTLLPSPNLKAEDIKVYNPGEDLDEPLAIVKSLVADLTLSSLINGDFDVKMMSLEEPDIRLEVMENGKLNWDGTLTDEQRNNLENMQITLDSVMIEKAKLNLIDTTRDINLHLDNLNAEVIAQSIFGPYRIEGTYLKDNNPEGFAFSIGKLANGFATTVNLVINQPATETFVRFDGSVLPQNNAINGNLIFESKKLMNFVNSNFKDFKLKPEYDYPTAVTLEVKSNKTKIELTNFVAKYGETAGAGNLLIPLPEEAAVETEADGEKKVPNAKVELAFNFTDLDLEPVVKLVTETLNQYRGGQANYHPNFKFDLLSDIKAVKTRYQDQSIKEFKLSLDLIDNKITLRDLSGVLPGDAATSVKGDIYSDLGYLTFNLATSFKTDEFLQTLKWLKIEPKTNQDTVLRRIFATANLAGNFQKVSINPFELSVDKSTIKGEMGIINDEKLNIYFSGASDMINFDNYIKPLSKEIASQDFAARMNYRFAQLGFLKDVYAELRLKLDLGIYESIPFENVILNGSFQQGELQIADLNVGSVANATINLKGKVRGFGATPAFENLKYEVATKDFASFLNKLDIKAPDIDLKKLKEFSSKGIATGSFDRMAMKTVSKLDNISITYGGQMFKKEGELIFNGDLDVRSPDFVKMLHDFNLKYEPNAFALGLFNMKGKFVGKPDYFAINPLNFNIGANTFSGDISYSVVNDRKNIVTNLDINKFEIDKFFYNNALIKEKGTAAFRQSTPGKVDFLSKPSFDPTKLNYAFYNDFDFAGNFKIARINYQDVAFDMASFGLNLKDTIAKLEHFKADYHGGKINADLEMGMAPDRPFLKGLIELNQYKIADNTLHGSKYGFKGGSLDAKISFDTVADSFDNMFNMINADIDWNVNNTIFLGWNLQNIYKDLLVRETSDGLTMFVKNNLQNGEEPLQNIRGKMQISKGEYSITNANAEAEKFFITINDSGSLANWEANAKFGVKYKAPDYLPGYNFSLSGSLMSPALEVNTDDLAIMYNNRQADIEAQNEAARQAERDILDKELNNSLMMVKAAESEVQNVIRPDLNSKMDNAKNLEAIEIYKTVDERIKKLEATLAEQQLMAKTPNATRELIDIMNGRNQENGTELQEIKKIITDNNIRNLKYVINESYTQITEQNNQAKQLALEYRSQYAELGKRLSKVITAYQLREDQNIKRLKERLDGNILALDNITNSIQSDYVNMQGSKDAGTLEKYAQNINIQLMDAMKYVPSITDAKQELLSYADQRIKFEEDAYKKTNDDYEINRKLEENTGSISVKGSGSKTVVRDLEDIEKSETAVDKQDIKVLDFSDEKTPVINRIHSEKDREVKPMVEAGEDKLLKAKTKGEISRATGVIIKK